MSLILSGTDGLSDVDGSAATPAIRGTDANTGIFFPAADTIAFAEGGAEVARFDSAGNFGIGTATPYRQFQVGNYSTNAIMALGSSPTSTGTLIFASADSAPGRYVGSIDYNHTSNYLSFTANASERMRIDSSGNLLVGTTTSNSAKVTMSNAGAEAIQFYPGSASNDNQTLHYNRSASVYCSNSMYAADHRFYIGGAEKARIDSSGNLLVGTTSQILSNTKFNFSSSQGVALGGMGFVNTVAPTIKWQIGPDNAGNFVIFNGSAVGVYVANGATAWTAYSDERLKTTIIPFENAAAKVATLRAGTGRYLKDAEGTSRSFLIAQDVQKVLPEAVDANNPDALGLSYTDVIPLLVAAIKEQQALIQTLTDRITALENK